jgi:hypothetical protein
MNRRSTFSIAIGNVFPALLSDHLATTSQCGMLTGKQGKLKAVELEGTGMNLEYEVRTVMRQSANALTVDQVAQAVAERAKDEIRSILNTLDKKGELHSVHGGGGYRTVYKSPPVDRRF